MGVHPTWSDMPAGPIEVWLSQANMEITCQIVFEDESVLDAEIASLSIRGAQREITGELIARDYKPAGRWEDEASTEAGTEVMRRFKPGK